MAKWMGPGTEATSTVSKPDGASWGSSLLLWFYQPLSARKGGAGEDRLCTRVSFLLVAAHPPGASTRTKHTCSWDAEPREARSVCYFTSAEVFRLKPVIKIIAGRQTIQEQSANCGTAGLRSKPAAGKNGLGAASQPTHAQPSRIILWYLCIYSGLEDSAQSRAVPMQRFPAARCSCASSHIKSRAGAGGQA